MVQECLEMEYSRPRTIEILWHHYFFLVVNIIIL